MMPEIPNQKSMLPLSFAVDVVGIKQQATVQEDLSDMACYKYRVRFENGIEDIFTIIEGPENTIEASEAGYEHYSRSLTTDLYELSKIVPENFLSVLPVKLQGEDVNVWLSEEEPDPGEIDSVMVSYNGNFGFQLYRASEAEEWKYREYKPTALTEEEINLAKELCLTMQATSNAFSSKTIPSGPH
jgi:hypothetical protein